MENIANKIKELVKKAEAELGLDLAGAFDQFFADIADGQNGKWDDGERDEDEGDALFGVGGVGDETDAAQEARGALDDLVGDGGECNLELVGVGETPRKQIAGRIFLKKRERQNLELPEEIETDGFEDARAYELNEIRIEIGRDATDDEHGGNP